jgi:GNAT superfamily N-acetyltransferase
VIQFRAPRPIEAGDVAAVAALWHEAWHDAHATIVPVSVSCHRTPDTFATRLAAFGTDALVVDDGAGPAAFAALVGAEIDQFFLARRARGTGLAAALMDRLEGMLVAAGHERADIECVAGNTRALRFYRSRGFVDVDVADRPVWMPDGAAATVPIVHLTKTLGS